MNSCGECACYHERKEICAVDGKRRTRANGCFQKFIPKGDCNGDTARDTAGHR